MHDVHPLGRDQAGEARRRCAQMPTGSLAVSGSVMCRPPARSTSATIRPPGARHQRRPAGARDGLGDLDRAALDAAGDEGGEDLEDDGLATRVPKITLHR